MCVEIMQAATGLATMLLVNQIESSRILCVSDWKLV